jgi:formylglycine-generating enzyme required for sulfatase activity
VDVERVALVLSEALVEWQPPILPEELDAILGPRVDVRAALVTELQQSRLLLTGEPHRRAQMALAVFAGAESSHLGRESHRVSAFEATPYPARRWLRKVLLVLLLIALLGFVFWQQRQVLPIGMVAVPDGSYFLPRAGETLAEVESVYIGAFAIDQFEVTNRSYRICVERGACSWPVDPGSTTRVNYFTDPAFNEFPVVNVTQPMAARYCAWQDKRLPTAAEWQVAASLAPATNQLFRFPWGQSFDPQRTNSSTTEFGDTIVVGSFRPAGDSPVGAADMSGNVAEWTATVAPMSQSSFVAETPPAVETPQMEGSEGAKSEAVVKGGSFASGVELLTAGSEMYVEIETAMPELGFRCAVSQLLGP